MDHPNFRNTAYILQVGSTQGFGPWLDQAESRISSRDVKPASYDQAMEYEQASCAFLKETVKANKMMKRVKEAAEGMKMRLYLIKSKSYTIEILIFISSNYN